MEGGGNPLQEAHGVNILDMGLELADGHIPLSRTSAWQAECDSLPTNTNEREQFRVETSPNRVSTIMKLVGPCKEDLFAFRLSAQLPRYMSWKSDQGSIATDALSQSWREIIKVMLSLHFQ